MNWKVLGEFVLIAVACLILVAAFVYAVVLGAKAIYESSSYREPELLCAAAGYPESKYISGEWYCIGIRDGSSVVVPVSEVGR